MLAPGRGFGDGTHETTQLCLIAVGHFLHLIPPPARVLDFGAGNGVLSIAAARAGATVEAVEIDEGALQETRHNAALNGVAERIDARAALSEPARPFELVVANVLCGVLVEHAAPLCARVAPAGHLVLSGLVATDVPIIAAAYRPHLGGHALAVHARGEWRAVVFSPSTA